MHDDPGRHLVIELLSEYIWTRARLDWNNQAEQMSSCSNPSPYGRTNPSRTYPPRKELTPPPSVPLDSDGWNIPITRLARGEVNQSP